MVIQVVINFKIKQLPTAKSRTRTLLLLINVPIEGSHEVSDMMLGRVASEISSALPPLELSHAPIPSKGAILI